MKYTVSYSVNRVYEIEVEAETEEEARDKIESSDGFDDTQAICEGEEFLGVNWVAESGE